MGTRATGTWETAPAEVLATTAVRPAERRLGIITPWAPAHSAVRITAPRLWGSESSSQTTTRGGSPRSRAACRMSSTVAVGPDGGHGHSPLVSVGKAHGVQLPPVALHHHHPRSGRWIARWSQGRRRSPPGQIELVDGGPRPQSLQHRVAALDDPVGFRCGLPPMVPSLPHISCRLSVLLCSSIPYFPAEQKKYFSDCPRGRGAPASRSSR